MLKTIKAKIKNKLRNIKIKQIHREVKLIIMKKDKQFKNKMII